MDYWVDARLVIGSTDISWAQGPYSTMDGLTFDVDLIFPVETVLSNPNLLADLCVDVRAYVDETMYIVNGSNPESWYDTGNGTGTGYPATEFRNSAVTLGFDTEWDSQDNLNGVQR